MRTGRRPLRSGTFLAGFALAAALAMLVAGCAEPTTGAKRDPVTLRIGVAVPRTNSPGSGVPAFVGNQLTDSLVGIGWDGRPVDRLVSDWSWDSDRELRLYLRPDLQFHDGTPVTLEHFKDSLERTLRDPRAVATAISYRSVTGVVIYRRKDDTERDSLIVKLSRPEPFILIDLANSVLRHPTNENIGVGPYKLISREKTVRLAAFDKYYRGRPNIDIIEVKDFEEQRSSWAALMRGEIDAVHEIAPGSIDFVERENAVRTFPFTRPYFISLFFNVKHSHLKNPLVRQALSYAVDREAVINLGLNGQGVVAQGPIWPSHWAYSTAQKTYSRNAEAATLRLDAAGLKMKPARAAGQMPSRLRFTCLTVAKDQRYEKLALILQKQLYEIGVDMNIEAVPGTALMERMMSGNFDAVLMERTSGRSLAWTYYFFHSSTMSMGYSAADRVLDKLRIATTDGEVRQNVSELQQILHDDPPAIFIAWPQVARAVSTKFAVPEEKGRDVMSSLWLWKPSEAGR